MKKILFIFIMLVLWFPLLQEKFKIINFKELFGVTDPPKKPELNKQSWFDGSFQENYEKSRGAKYGCREFFIRLYNQIDYSFFRLTNTGVVIAKNDYLFETNYLTDITGLSFHGEEHIKNEIQELYKTQRYLADRNILLVTVLVPAKTYYYPEYIPDYYQRRMSDDRDYYSILRNAKAFDLNLIDANVWFMKMKDTSSYPLFPKQGIHWNTYGMALTVDSIVKFIESKNQIDLADVKYSIEIPDQFQGTDNDLGDVLNLLFKQPNPLMPFARFNIDTINKRKPRLLAVGDSFYWTIANSGVYQKIFSNPNYYYYNHEVHDSGGMHKEEPADYNLLRELNNFDIILFVQSSPNYYKIGSGFIQLLQKNLKTHEEYKKKYSEKIMNENLYADLVSDYSRHHQISTETASAFVADSLASSYMDLISEVKFHMRDNNDWISSMQDKANKWGITIEEVMDKDAVWMLEQKEKK